MSVIKKSTILIVDDNRDAADTLAMLIESMGFRAMTAYDTPAGLKLARDISPQIIFHDIGMSGMDGYMAARQLRSEAQFAKTYLIALTAYTLRWRLQRRLCWLVSICASPSRCAMKTLCTFSTRRRRSSRLYEVACTVAD